MISWERRKLLTKTTKIGLESQIIRRDIHGENDGKTVSVFTFYWTPLFSTLKTLKNARDLDKLKVPLRL